MDFVHENQAPQTQPGHSPEINWEQEAPSTTCIKVIGVGGGGCNAVSDMVQQGFTGVEFYAVNTDFQALNNSVVPNKVQIGETITTGLGTGAKPELGEKAAREAEAELRHMLEGADMVFITAGLGGGTGTGAAPVIAEIAREMGILNVAIVTKPFSFEGPPRMRRARAGVASLQENVDTMIVILNDKLMETVGPKTPLTEAFSIANGVLAQGIRAISDLISKPGLINVDFRDVRTIMGETGGAVMGVGVGKGENRAVESVKKACHSPLQEKIVIDGARGILINITGGSDVTMQEIHEATSTVYELADPDANVIFGVVIDDKMQDEMRVTIIATGFDNDEMESAPAGALSAQALPKPGTASFAAAPPAPQAEIATPAPSEEPALTRKQREPEPAEAMPSIDFGSDDNPLRDWGKPEEKPEAAPEPEVDQEPSAPAIPSAPAFNDVEPQLPPAPPASDSDPSDIPALDRRRRQRFFE